MEYGGVCTSNSLSIANRRGSAQTANMKRRLPSSINTGTVEKKPRIESSSSKTPKRAKPWEGKNFQLDIEDKAIRGSISKDIVKFGGTIIDEFSSSHRQVHFVVSDSIYAKYLEEKKPITTSIQSKMGGILRNAYERKLSVKSANNFLKQVVEFRKKHAHIFLSPSTAKTTKPRVHKLKAHYMKIEDMDQQYLPIYKEFVNPTFKKIYIGAAAGKSVFHQVTPEELEKRASRKVRKPVARPEYRKGQCEICNVACPNLQEHYATREHVRRVRQPDFYCEVDALCGSYLEEIKVINCRTLPPRRTSPPRRSPSPCSDIELHTMGEE